MDWGDAAGWAAFAISGGALFVSGLAQKDSRRSAVAAEESVREARLSREAAQRTAAVAEQTLLDQRREAAERRAAEEEASRPRVELRVEYRGKHNFLLINQGAAKAEHIRPVEDYPAMDPWPRDLALAENEVHRFGMIGGGGHRVPAAIRVVWDGQEAPIVLRVPPNGA
ncbi:hypothetical protein C5F59_027600 [Streptomyces sp. QL37]|uniref:hypothetical protein n=1 Tax=Streptomyces sp. QL37 TaxID=2093747 RepID=UPI000CF2FA5C|nr:hypothetical protein [Streptomyces sp. QL37]PPQ57123.1 hypothetical protein C5F59_10840 [Streptomyces sp. QL37]